MQTYIKPCKHGNFLLLKSDFISDCMSLYGEWAEREVDLFESLLEEGDQVIEVGSNIGTHAIALANKIGRSGKLICIEAQRIIYQILTANIAINNLTNVRSLCAVAADKSGGIFLKEADFGVPANRGAYSVINHATQEKGELTAVFSLDSLVDIYKLERLKLLKVDVEGMEEAVLKGAEKCIRTFEPYIFFECGTWQKTEFHQRGDAINNWLAGLGYKTYWYNCLGFNPANYNKINDNRVGSFGDINILAVPKSKAVKAGLKEVISVAEIFKGEISWVSE